MNQIVIPKGWIQIEGHCFVDNKNKARFKQKFTNKSSKNQLSKASKYADTHKEEAKKRSKDWKKLNLKRVKESRDEYNSKYQKCIQNVLKLRRSINSKSYIANNKKNSKKLRDFGFLSRCAEYKHNTCKNMKGRCKCPCHKNT